ncbi:MAG: AAA family ATPase [Deltaproteobacteria bacterium]|nr:AAA family ATPase [Deltaproteobacteria bacterium]
MDVNLYDFSCQKALYQGLQYARSFGHQALEVEHVALALLRAGGVELSVASRLQRHIEAYLSRAPRVLGQVKVVFGTRLDQALDQAEARSKPKLVPARILWEELQKQSTLIQNFTTRAAEEASAQSIRDAAFEPMVTRQASGEGVATSSGKAKREVEVPIPRKEEDEFDQELRQYTIDISATAERGELDPVIGRDMEVRRVLEILGRKKKNNPLLIGEPGVGKSAIAEALAIRIASGAVPESMRGKRVFSLDLGAMLAGAKYRGEFESRMKNLLNAVASLKGKIILFIDEIHMLVGAGNHEGSADAANLLKPALARGELQCLGATTIDEYRKYIEKDAALERRFQPINVEEPTAQAALAILRGLKSHYEIHHGIQIADEALEAAVSLSVRYVPQRKLPDKAIDLIDEAASRLRLQVDSVPAVLDELASEISQIEVERKAISPQDKGQIAALAKLEARLEKAQLAHASYDEIWRSHQNLLQRLRVAEKNRLEGVELYRSARSNSNFDFAARLQFGELPKLSRETDKIKLELDRLQQAHNFLRRIVGAREIAEIIALWTRIPISKLMEKDNSRLLTLEARLATRIYGQNDALYRIAQTLKRARVGVNDPRRPLGVFLFLGPTGVGKTETAKALAEELFSDESKIIRIDMSEFMEQHQIARLIGAPPGYVGFGDGGELTEAVRQRPYAVVLLDEIEKAHPRVLDLLLQTFDDGRLTDGRSRLVDFRNTLIIMTSNLSLDRIVDPERASDESVRRNLAMKLRPEFVNRIDEVVVFKRLGKVQLRLVLKRLLGELNLRLADRQFIIRLGHRLQTRLLTTGAEDIMGGRAIRRDFTRLVVDAVSERVLAYPGLANGTWQLDLDRGGRAVWTYDHRRDYYLPPAG